MATAITFDVSLLDPSTGEFGAFGSGMVVDGAVVIAGLPSDADQVVRGVAGWMAQGDWRPNTFTAEAGGARWRVEMAACPYCGAGANKARSYIIPGISCIRCGAQSREG